MKIQTLIRTLCLIWGAIAQLFVFTGVFAGERGWDMCPFDLYGKLADQAQRPLNVYLWNLYNRQFHLYGEHADPVIQTLMDMGIAQNRDSAKRLFETIFSSMISYNWHTAEPEPVDLLKGIKPVLLTLSPNRKIIFSKFGIPTDPELDSHLSAIVPSPSHKDIDPSAWIEIFQRVQAIFHADIAQGNRYQGPEWVIHHRMDLTELYGLFSETWLAQHHVGIIPGTQVKVHHMDHADGIRYEILEFNGSKKIYILGLDEIKITSLQVINKGQNQIQGFLQRLRNHNDSIELFAHVFSPRDIYIRLKDGPVLLTSLRHHSHAAIDGKWKDFKSYYRKIFPEDFFRVLLPTNMPMNPDNLGIPVVVSYHPYFTREDIMNKFYAFVTDVLQKQIPEQRTFYRLALDRR